MCYQVQAYDADEHPTTEVSCACLSNPICETKHEVAQQTCNYFVKDFNLCNRVALKRPYISKVYDHYDAGRELHSNLRPNEPVKPYDYEGEKYPSNKE